MSSSPGIERIVLNSSSIGGLTCEITVKRHSDYGSARVADLPDDIRKALLEWLSPVAEPVSGPEQRTQQP
jgi:hypothetical protein